MTGKGVERNRRTVGIAELKAGKSGEVLVTLGLGSCVVVALYEKKRRIGTLAHIMLPSRESGRRREGENMNKYADVAIPESLRLIEQLGGRRPAVTAKIAGGACMFDLGKDGYPDIGRRNVEAVRELLAKMEIPLESEDTGGDRGRSVEFSLDTGGLLVRMVRGEERVI